MEPKGQALLPGMSGLSWRLDSHLSWTPVTRGGLVCFLLIVLRL